MNMTVQLAREVARALIDAADTAEAAGQTEFDLTAALQSQDDAARAALEQEIGKA